jgi:hypothetical protein
MDTEARLEMLREATPNSCIALSEDESSLVGRGSTYSEASDFADRAGFPNAVLIKIPSSWAPTIL